MIEMNEFNRIETERSFLNSIEQAIEDFNKYPENATRQALWRHCDDARQAPTYVLQRLDEYVHKNYLPPHLKTALFEHAKLSVPKLVSVTKYIFADVLRAVAYQQTCLGLVNASEELKIATLNRHRIDFESILKTLIEWEQSMVPIWAVNEDFEKEALQKLIEFGSDSKSNEEKYGERSTIVLYLAAAGQVRLHLQNKFGNITGQYKQIHFSVTIFDTKANHTIKIFEPYRAKALNVILKVGKREHNVTVIVSWVGFTENTNIDQLIQDRKNRYNSITGYVDLPKEKCFPKRSMLEKLAQDQDNQELILELEPAALSVVSLEATSARTGGMAYFLDICGDVNSSMKDRAYMTIEL